MTRAILLLGLLLGVVVLPAAPAAAGDQAIWRYNRHSDQLPYPHSWRAQTVWEAGACWSGCGSQCTWAMVDCLAVDAQGRCLKRSDACDRYCQRACRSYGGPLLPIDTLFPLGY